MIVILLAIVGVAAAKPTSQPGSYVIDGVEGMVYEISEYEDPEIALFQLSAMGIMPLLTALQVAEDSENLKEQDTSQDRHYEDLEDLQKKLDDAIDRLQLARNKLEKGSCNIHVDIEVSLRKLMELDHRLHTDIHPVVNTPILDMVSSDRDESHFKIETDMSSTETLISSEKPDYDSKSYNEKRMETPSPLDIISSESNFKTETDMSSTETPISSEKPDFESRSYNEKRMEALSPMDFYFSETNKYQDVEKPSTRKKWILKSSVKE